MVTVQIYSWVLVGLIYDRYRQTNIKNTMARRRAKGVIPRAERLAMTRKYAPGEKYKMRLARWSKAGPRAAKERRAAERLRSNFIQLPADHRKFLKNKRINYIDWWKRTLHRQSLPPKVVSPKIPTHHPKTLAHRIRRRLKRILKVKIGLRTCELIGCTSQYLKAHIATMFTKQMSWANYGKVWHIDHIIPLSKFNLSNKTELLQSCHFSNLQPLLALDNLNKAAKTKPFQLSLFPPTPLPPTTPIPIVKTNSKL